MPNKFVQYYDKAITAKAKKTTGIDYEDDTIYISKSAVESQFFGSTLKGIIGCTMQAIKENRSKVNTFYLVGGFGGFMKRSQLHAIKKVKGSHCNIIVPVDPHLGNFYIWRKNPEMINARKSDATYEIVVALPVNSTKHDSHYKS